MYDMYQGSRKTWKPNEPKKRELVSNRNTEQTNEMVEERDVVIIDQSSAAVAHILAS